MRYNQQPSTDERPKLFLQPHPLPGGYNQLLHPQLGVKYMPGTVNYPPPSAALHLSADYWPHGNSSASPASTSAKQSREELNRKEKQRMFKLNERITQLKLLLDEAGVQSKKNKQSVLDNTSHYIEMLRSDLIIAQQKAERAKRQAEASRAQPPPDGHDIVRSVFEKATTPRVIVDMNLRTVVFNAAFVRFTGLSELSLKKKKTLRPYICADPDQLEAILQKLGDTKQSVSVLVNVSSHSRDESAVNLVAAIITDDTGEAAHIEFSLIPVDMPLRQHRPRKRQKTTASKATAARSNRTKDAAVYTQQ